MTEWMWEWKREMSFFVAHALAFTWKNIPSSVQCVPQKNFIIVGKGNSVECYLDKDGVEQEAKKMVNQGYSDSDFIRKYSAAAKKHTSQLVKFSKLLSNKDYIQINNKKLSKLLEAYFNYYAMSQTPVAAIRTFNRKGMEVLQKSVPKKDLNTVLYSEQDSVNQQEEKELAMISLNIGDKEKFLIDPEKFLRENKKISDMLNSHCRKYCYMTVGYADEPALTASSFLDRLILITQKGPEKILKDMREKKKENLQKKREKIQALGIEPKTRNIINIMSSFSYYKDYLRFEINKSHYFSIPLFKELGRRLSLSSWDVKYVTSEEIQLALDGKIDYNAIIKKRQQSFYVRLENEKVIIKLGAEAENEVQAIINQSRLEMTEIEGMPACHGKVIGKVKIIEKTSDYKGETGFIIVSPMTTPELMPIMKKASAIVTDEGGITCHAAIISRELGIPCIIGTKIATKVLKTGDLVEVNANHGVVRIIKKEAKNE